MEPMLARQEESEIGPPAPDPFVQKRAWYRRRRPSGAGFFVGISIGVLLYLIGVPLAFLIWSSFRKTGHEVLPFSPEAQYSVENYGALFAPGMGQTLLNTAFFSVGSLALGVAIAALLAWLVERTDLPWRGPVFVMALAPIAMPAILLSIAWILLLGPQNGFLNHIVRSLTGASGPGPLDIYSIPGMILVQGLVTVPTTFLLLGPAFRLMDPALEDAALMAGASRRRITLAIILPLLLPAIGNAIVYQLITVVQAFEVPITIGIPAKLPVLSTRVYIASSTAQGLPDYGVVSTYAVFLLVVSLAPLVWYMALTRRAARYATVTGRGYRPERVALGRWKPVAVAFVITYATFTIILPLLIMLWMSLQRFYSQPSIENLSHLSLRTYSELATSDEFRGALVNTGLLAVTAASVATLLAMAIGWAIVRGRGRAMSTLDLLSFAPHVVPGVVVGSSALLLYLLLFVNLGVPIHGTVWVVVIGVTTVTLGYGIRSFRAAVLQLGGELEEAGRVSGAGWFGVMRHIVFPLLRSNITNIWLWTFLSAMTTLTIPLMLYSGRNIVLATSIYFRWQTGQPGSAAAMGVILMLFSLALSIVVYRVGRRSP